ncbi:MAG: hypothetical protein J7L63_05495 [Thermoplasmata archaeon]|nr:hypothetical protein [Thermoplasmata archaeon]
MLILDNQNFDGKRIPSLFLYVLSRKDFTSRFIKGGVYKLNTEKIKCIIREKERGELSTGEIARIQKVSRRRVLQTWAEYRKYGKVELKKVGRRRKLLEGLEMLILSIYDEQKRSAIFIEKILRGKE